MKRSKKILVVDDCDINIILMEALFEINEFNLISAKSANEAFDIINKEKISIILLDLVMPNIDGFQILKTLKSDEKTKDIPVIIMSGLAAQENIDKCTSLGVVDYIVKPINLTYLINKVHEVLHIELIS